MKFAKFAFQLSRLADLEEIVAEQDNRLAVAQGNLSKMKTEMEKVKEAKDVELKMLKKKMRLYVFHTFIFVSKGRFKENIFSCKCRCIDYQNLRALVLVDGVEFESFYGMTRNIFENSSMTESFLKSYVTDTLEIIKLQHDY